ncbi:Diacylglycerol O-acyltransferase 2A [Pleurostoma richardsiae]|uniref:diacylglycerol O-acyltransferase n=1 Tax=Pleurostoma richardsiae TaxID=41990 RepID=A0AA38S1S5_9PEZI|nr:Diacylglycerol O-acyltransferase 2A [Pleurostoma richardsiae]
MDTSASRPPNERQESAHEYGGEGLDSSPRTPTKHRKTPSIKSEKTDTKSSPQSDHLSYADAVKEDPVDVEKREANHSSGKTNGDAESQPVSYAGAVKEPADTESDANLSNGKTHDAQSGHLTYAQAVKEDPAEVEQRDADVSVDRPVDVKPLDDEDTASENIGGMLHTKASGDGTVDVNGDGTGHSHDLHTSCELPSSAEKYPSVADIEETAKEAHERDHKEAAPELAGIRWAPLRVPLRRRFQTAAVLGHSICMGSTLTIFFFLCALPFLWPLIIIYLLYILQNTDATDGRLRGRREWFRNLRWWTYFGEYFPAKLHKTHELPATRKYIFGYHPHGIISHGAWVAFGSNALGFSEKFPGITNSLLTLDSNFRLPLYREYVLSMGCCSVSKESITNILTRGGANNEGMGRAVTIVVGGARESLEAQPGTLHLIFKERKGFIKLAVRTGADLVPVLAFGENELYDQLKPAEYPRLHRFQMHVLKVWKFTLPFLHGRGIFNYDVGMMPYRRSMNIVVGKPIKVVQDANPQNDEVDRLHGLYSAELQKIWDTYKDEFAKGRKEELRFLD